MSDLRLAGAMVILEPLEMEHREALLLAAADGELWNLTVTAVPGPTGIDSYIERAIAGRADGTVTPFAIIGRKSGRLVGSTRFWKIDRPNRKLEIGHTWLALSAQRTGINTEVKYLMIHHAF
jgi:RimJ/RimL family protein N-acetyltransferase